MNKLKIRNRTSSVAPAKTAERIERLLAEAGANRISKSYTAGELSGIEFILTTQFGVLAFRLPVNVDGAYKVLTDNNKGHLSSFRRKQLREQAERTAWKLAQESLEIQLSQVAMNQMELAQALFPHIVKDGVTLFDYARQGGYQNLLAAPSVRGEVVE